MPKLKSRKVSSPVWPLVLTAIVTSTVSDTLRNRFGWSTWGVLALIAGIGTAVLLVRYVLNTKGRRQPDGTDA